MRCAKSVTAGADCESAWHQLLSLSQSHIYSCTDLSSCICVQAGVLLDLLEMPAEGRPALQRRAVKLGLLQVRLQHSLQSLVLSRVYFCCNFLQTLAMSTIVKPMMTPDPALMSSTYRCPGLNPDPALVSQMKQRSQPQDPAQPRVLLQGSVDLGLLICYMEGPPGFTNHSCLLRATVTEVLEAISDMLDFQGSVALAQPSSAACCACSELLVPSTVSFCACQVSLAPMFGSGQHSLTPDVSATCRIRVPGQP